MDAALELEAAVGTVAVDRDDRFLDPADPGLVEAHQLRREAVAVRVPGVHPVELRREEGSLLAAGTGPDLEDDVAVVVRVARQQQHAQVRQQALLEDFEPVDLVAGHLFHVVVGLSVAHLAGTRQLPARLLELAVRSDDRFEPRELATEPPQRVGIRGGLGQRELGLQVVVLVGNLGELGIQAGHDRLGGSPGEAAVGCGGTGTLESAGSTVLGPSRIGSCSSSSELAGMVSPSALSASCIDTIATSIMSSVGRLVVIIWTRIPGYMITLTSGLARCRAPKRRIS